MHPSTKLFHQHLRTYIIKKQVGLISYRLKLSLSIKRLHLVFYVIKLTAAAEDLILEQYAPSLLDSIIVNREKE